MATLKTKFSVGLFLICGITVVILAVVWLGMSNYLEKGQFFVAYFDESVQGLDVDSPVKYRGVSIGRVQAIHVAPDEHLIEVILKIETNIKAKAQTTDFVAQLKSVGITGLMFIEIEHIDTGTVNVSPSFKFTPPYPVIATRASEISKIFKGVEDVFNTFRALDTQTISEQLTLALQKINRAIDEARLVELIDEFHGTLAHVQNVLQSEKVDRLLNSMEQSLDSFHQMARNADGGISDIRKTVSRLDGVIVGSADDLKQITADLQTAASQIKAAMENANALLDNTNQQVDTIQRRVVGTINRIDQATESLSRFLDHIGNQPSQVIFSAPTIDKPLNPGR